MATYNEQMQRLANRYMAESGMTEFTARDLARWAIGTALGALRAAAPIVSSPGRNPHVRPEWNLRAVAVGEIFLAHRAGELIRGAGAQG